MFSLAVIMRNLSRLRRNLCDCKENGHINKRGHIAQWRLNLSLLPAKICRGCVVLAIKFVVFKGKLAWFLCGVVS